eukprot:scaffold528_cov165-Amphora_coffeaeformis.AAC.23
MAWSIVRTVQMKNCEPLVPGPAFAILKMPFPTCLSSKFSSCYGKKKAQRDHQHHHYHSQRLLPTQSILMETHLKLGPIDGLSTGSVSVGKITTIK